MAKYSRDFKIENSVLTEYTGSDAHVVIPEGVKEIGKLAFQQRFRMKSVSIPDSVIRIGEMAFWRCSGLETIVIPSGVHAIGDQAFGNCSGLKTVTIPAGITEISTGLFWQCGGLESVRLPDGITRIGNVAFVNCYSLKSVVLPAGVKSIGNSAFSKCRALTSVSLPEGLEEIDGGAFMDCESLARINLPDSLKRIGRCAFQNCKSLRFDPAPICLPQIGEDAFQGASPALTEALTEAQKRNIPIYCASVVTAGSLRPHRHADGLQCADINGHNVIVGKSCYPGERLVYFPIGGQLDAEFAKENRLLRGDQADGQPGGYLHPVRRNITILKLRGEVSEGLALPIEVLEKYADIHSMKDGDRFFVLNGKRLCRIYIPEEMDFDVREKTLTRYRENKNTPRNVYIPWGTEIIGSGAFAHCRHLSTVVLPETVRVIRERAFYDCPNLKTVKIPGSVEIVCDAAFAHCGSLAADSLPGKFQNAFSANDFDIKNGRLVRYRGKMRDVKIPEGVTEIESGAFAGKCFIQRVSIPEHVTKIGCGAFADCKGLEYVSIPNGVQSIGDQAFIRCKALHEVALPSSVKAIGDHAFGEYYFYKHEPGLKFPVEIYRKYGDFRMVCEKGSAAEQYARKNHLTCLLRGIS